MGRWSTKYLFRIERGVHMNKLALKKLLQAKQLEYEAIKEIMLEAMRAHVELAEEEALSFIKEVAWTMFWKDDSRESADAEGVRSKANNQSYNSEKENQDINNKDIKQSTRANGRSKKIKIDFSEG